MKSQNPISESNIVPSVDINAPLKIDLASDQSADKDNNNQKNEFYVGLGFFCLITVSVILLFIFSISLTTSESNLIEFGQSPQQSPVGEPLQEIVRSAWTIEVLNGSGVPGKAKIVSDKLRNSGYLVLPPGNYSGTLDGNQIFIASDFTSQKDLFIKDVSVGFGTATYSGLLTNSTASARIILGK